MFVIVQRDRESKSNTNKRRNLCQHNRWTLGSDQEERRRLSEDFFSVVQVSVVLHSQFYPPTFLRIDCQGTYSSWNDSAGECLDRRQLGV